MQHFIKIDLEKAHVKAHFRRDPVTGKLIFIKDYDSTVHAHLVDKVFEKGDKVIIDKPSSKHHGKELEVTGYNEKYGIAGKVVGSKHLVEVHPDHLNHAPAAPVVPTSVLAPVDPPVVAVVAPVVPVSPPASVMSIDDAKLALRVIGKPFAGPAMLHEQVRLQTMDVAALTQRIGKIKDDQKLYNFYRAVDAWGTLDQKAGVIPALEKELLARANGKQSPPASTPPPVAQPAAAPVVQAPASTGPIVFAAGDKVKVVNPKSKHDGKEGVVLGHSVKYGVRIKLDDGSICESRPDTVKHVGKPQVVTLVAHVVTTPDPVPVVENSVPKTPLDFPNDRRQAWEHATYSQQSVGEVTGMLPLDHAAEMYLKDNLKKITAAFTSSAQGARNSVATGGYAGNKSRTGYMIPKWAMRVFDYGIRSNISSDIAGKFVNSGPKESPLDIINAPAEVWEKAGYDFSKEISIDLASAKDAVIEAGHEQKAFRVFCHVNEIMVGVLRTVAAQRLNSQLFSSLPRLLLKGGFTMNMKLADLAALYKEHTPEADIDAVVSMLHSLAGTNARNQDPGLMTIDQVLSGLHSHLITPANPYGNNVADLFSNQFLVRIMDHPVVHAATRKAILNEVFTRSGEFKKAIAWILTGVGPEPSYYNIRLFDTGLPDRPIYAATDKVEAIFKRNPHIKEQFIANSVIDHSRRQVTANFSKAFSSQIFPKPMMEEQGPREVGVRVAKKMKGTFEEAGADLAKKYLVQVAKQKALEASGNKPVKSKSSMPDSVGCTFRSVDAATEARIRKEIKKSWDTKAHDSFGHKIHGIYQIGGQDAYEAYKKIIDKRDNLFIGYHSTSFPIAAAIIKSEYRPSSGGMLGGGVVYVTDVSSKSAQYLNGDCARNGISRAAGTRGCFIINKVSLGTVHDKSIGAKNDKAHNEKNITKADSIFAPKGTHVPGYRNILVNDEHAVKAPKAILPMYWVDMEITR